jgi:hypothetical protein
MQPTKIPVITKRETVSLFGKFIGGTRHQSRIVANENHGIERLSQPAPLPHHTLAKETRLTQSHDPFQDPGGTGLSQILKTQTPKQHYYEHL